MIPEFFDNYLRSLDQQHKAIMLAWVDNCPDTGDVIAEALRPSDCESMCGLI